MAKYAIWNKVDDIITPIGEVLSASEWIARYPVAKKLDTVCGGGVVNGAIFGIYEEFKANYERLGVDFSACTTKQECLDAIEAFEDAQNAPSGAVDANTRIADALEDLVVMNELKEG